METASRSDEARSSARSPALWGGLLVPPTAWAVQLVLSDMLFEMGCAPGVQGRGLFGVGLATWSLVVSVAAIAATAAAGLFSYRAWRRLRDLGSEATWAARAREMAWWGLVSVGIYLSIIVYGAFVPLILTDCSASL
jgi:uncharacterized membrane protein